MAEFLKKNRHLFVVTLSVLLLFIVCGGASAQKNAKNKKAAQVKADELNTSSEPDKVLYDRAMADIKKSRYTEGRLSLQTLINTYPDSEYLAKSKLAIADSFFKEGGTSNLMQAIAEYKDFITFFPFLDEAAYAQMQVGTCHYRMMEKPDRDTSQAQEAEQEFQTMLLKYPQSTFAPQAEQRLREVQEILADGEFRIARFYFSKMDYNAAGSRLVEVAERYPLYSQNDEVFWMLGESYMRAKQLAKNEDLKNSWAALAARSYDRLIEDYPMSKRVPDAKARLKSIGMPVPEPNPDAYARMQKEQAYQRDHHQNAIIKTPMSIVKTTPDVSSAAHSGQPNLNPPSDTYSAVDILKVGAAKPSFEATASSAGGGAAASNGSGGAVSETAPAEAVPQGSSSTVSPSGSAPATNVGVEIIATPTDANAAAAVSSQPSATAGAPPANARPPETVAPDNPPATGTTNSAVPAPAQPAPPENNSPSPSGAALATTPPAAQSGNSATSGGAQASSQASSSTDANSKTSDQQPTSKSNPKEESTSKKKKGLHKLIPW
jgi:outer membrane protein assembly factor BamD